ncbi:MAG: trimethylamine methyltransferase family protein, partial [Chloroflexi bacterium]|nr:trimethylamine methyltransferase family protein [Chloroflexota bacterium]
GQHYRPTLSDRDSRPDWEAKGAKVTWQRAAEKVDEIMAKEGYSLPPEIRERVLSEIDGMVDRGVVTCW